MNVAFSFAKRAVLEQTLLTGAAFVVTSVFAPVLLQLDEALLVPVVLRTLALGLPAAIAVGALTALYLRRSRFVLRAIALGSAAIEPSDIGTLSRVPPVSCMLKATSRGPRCRPWLASRSSSWLRSQPSPTTSTAARLAWRA